MTSDPLTTVTGIGPQEARTLREAGYTDVDDLREASLDEIAAHDEISTTRAARIKADLGANEIGTERVAEDTHHLVLFAGFDDTKIDLPPRALAVTEATMQAGWLHVTTPDGTERSYPAHRIKEVEFGGRDDEGGDEV